MRQSGTSSVWRRSVLDDNVLPHAAKLVSLLFKSVVDKGICGPLAFSCRGGVLLLLLAGEGGLGGRLMVWEWVHGVGRVLLVNRWWWWGNLHSVDDADDSGDGVVVVGERRGHKQRAERRQRRCWLYPP